MQYKHLSFNNRGVTAVSDHACQNCSWFHDFGNFGFCTNMNIKINELNKVEFEDLVKDNDCEHFDDDIWFGG